MSRLPYKLFSSWQFLRQGGARILTYKHVRLVSSLRLSYKFPGNSRFRRKSNDFRLWVKRHKVEIFKWILVYLILLGALVTQVKLIHLNSESVPYHFCLQFYNVQPKKGDLCVFNFKNLTFVKYLLGEAGDTVLKKGNFVYVNSKFVGKIKKVGGLSPLSHYEKYSRIEQEG